MPEPGGWVACPILILCTSLLSTLTANLMVQATRSVSVMSWGGVPGLALSTSSPRSLSRQLKNHIDDWAPSTPIVVLNIAHLAMNWSHVC